MSADDNARNQAPAWRHSGPGHSSSFLCACCSATKQVVGRKMRFICGLRQYVCAGCAPKGKA